MTRQVPPSWVWARFGDVAEVEANLVDPTTDKHAPHIAPNHIESRTGRLLPYSTVEADGVTSPKHAFTPNQILYSKIRPYLAKAVLVDFAGLCSADMYPIRSRIEPRYLHRWLISDEFTQQASWNQGRTVLPKINRSALDELPVPVPPENEQHRIVAKLDALMAKSRRAKEALDAIPPLLDKLRQSILAAAFRGDLTADWRAAHPDVEPASQLLQRIRAERRRRWEEAELAKLKIKGKTPTDDRWKAKYQEPEPVDESGLPELPEGWCWAKASDIVAPGADIVYGIVQPGPPLSGGVPYVRGTDIQNDQILVKQLWRTSEKIAAEYSRAMIQAGDVLLCIIRHLKVAVVPSELDGANLSRTTSRLRPATGIGTDFLANALRSPWCQNWLKSRYRGGTSMPKVNIADACELPIPIAPQAEQVQVAKVIENAFRMLKAVHEAFAGSTQDLALMDAAVLTKAFRGELVPQDPNDEPASVLLERIRSESGVQAKTRARRARSKTA